MFSDYSYSCCTSLINLYLLHLEQEEKHIAKQIQIPLFHDISLFIAKMASSAKELGRVMEDGHFGKFFGLQMNSSGLLWDDL